ncbi:unnamed protein product [Psylliodes chrysocephalus]|uniref:Uncharacterized protein n=1 Tax=Psylliodes chrysocephalus TaxID=3402493 RepID=A0A9P0DA26_9CUCU|nr:unnamed protein product [Psylliodes chrysocephala]
MGQPINDKDENENSDKDIENNDNVEAEVTEESEDSDEGMNVPLTKICFVKTNKENESGDTISVSYLGKTFESVLPISKYSVKKSDWLVVAFPASFGKTRKNKYFIGEVLDILGGSDFEKTFLKYRPS